ncbi:hypothetical protein Leryth_020862 [Lithospermum erythrorhizon]|nr:hypothetical protein Leryth_020862 [Lithospermum erythrorhizon]
MLVAVVSVSALTLIYLHRYSKPKYEQLGLALSEQIKNIVNWGIFDKFFDTSKSCLVKGMTNSNQNVSTEHEASTISSFQCDVVSSIGAQMVERPTGSSVSATAMNKDGYIQEPLTKTIPSAPSSDVRANHVRVERTLESSRPELHTFYEASPANIYSLSAHPISALPTLIKDPLYPAENFKQKGFLHSLLEASFPKNKESQNKKGFFINNNKNSFHQNGSKSLVPYPAQNAEHVKSGHRSRKFSTYNKFLKEGRLLECIEILKDFERKELLDMGKVHHASFLKACKNQKNVKAAFQFTGLIPNPTLSTFNMLMSVCASAHDTDGAFQILQLVQEAGMVADCKLYTTLITTCAKSGKVDTMFEVFHEMVNTGIEPNVHTYGALIDGCAKAGQIAKAFGAYGILRSKNVKPDRVVFNALITACGQLGAVARAFDVLAEMRAETQPIDPDDVTIGALIKACINSGQDDRAREVYKMIDEYDIKGTPELYTIAINSCSQSGDWEFACNVYNDMKRKGVTPDEMLISSLIDVAGHSGKLDYAFQFLEDAIDIPVGVIAYSSLMGACSNAKSWQRALALYEDIKKMNLKPTVSMMNALITALCDANQLDKASEALLEMKKVGLCPNTITYSVLLVASEKEDDLEVGLMLLSQAKKDGVAPNLVMCRCLLAMCLRRFQKACALGEKVLSFNSGRPHLDSKWTTLSLRIYREAIVSGVSPSVEELSQVLACLRLPHDGIVRKRLIENLLVVEKRSKVPNLCSLIDGFGEYDPRAFSLLEEAASLGSIPILSFQESPIVIDVRDLHISAAEVYILAVIRGLKHRLAAGAKLPNITILLPVEKTQIQTPNGEKSMNLAGRITQAVTAQLRRIELPYQGNASYGKIRIFGVVLKKWLQPMRDPSFGGKPTSLNLFLSRRLGKEITHQQRDIRTGHYSLD